ncbi:hypothetical protein CK203_035456 [Vitis vinifera]|uniref:Uncharacterized protein n=1 Tax=Vitis vinifera TaxID=29760 RepID=A0A438I3U0_VITVI|nr:hypothetical protein CK203_035456 [Vitis vinifera]
MTEGRFLGLLLAAFLSQGRLYRDLRSSCKLAPGFVSAPRFNMPAKKDVASSSTAGLSGKSLVDGDAMSTEKAANHAIYFSKEQFNAGLRILNMLFNLDLSLLEVLFVYTIKKEKTDLFSLFAHIPSLQLVTNLPDSNKGGAKGHVLVRGHWAGLSEPSEREFTPNRSWTLPCTHKRGRLVEWVEKASFDRLNRLFEITSIERH